MADAADHGSGPLISGVHPGGSTDWEHVRVVNGGDKAVDLSGWTLEDGEGRLTMPAGTRIGPGARVWVGTNSTSFRVLWGTSLDIVVARTGGFCLADRGDGLVLRDAEGGAIDQVVYGAPKGDLPDGWNGGPVPTPSSMPWGRLLLRHGLEDTDSAADWSDWREPRCGWSEDPWDSTLVQANASCFVTPGEGWEALTGAIRSARTDVSIALYDLTSRDLAAVVARKAREGVHTRVLLEGTPVGMTEDEEDIRQSVLVALARSGVEIWLSSSAVKGESHRPYRYHHEKYCVIDGHRVLVTTENWGISSFPSRPLDWSGSRGWGALVDGEDLARVLLSVFDHDLRTSAKPFEPGSAGPADLPAVPAPRPSRGTPIACQARLLVGPEGWGHDLLHLLGPIAEAERSILLELAYIDIWWRDQVSPLVEALLLASTRGVEVRIVLDPGLEGEGRASLDELHRLAAHRGVGGIRGVLARNLSDASRVHAKGALIDGRVAMLGSLNWAWSSVARNREVVVVLEGSAAVRPLLTAFEADWNASVAGLAPSPPRQLVLEAAQRWGGRTFPTHAIGPFEEEELDREPVLEVPWFEWLKVAFVLALVVVVRTVNRRYGLSQRASSWVEVRLERAGRALLNPSPRPSSREEAPDGPRTTCRGTDPAKEPPPRPPPDPPPRRRPRVVVLEEEEARW
jgi:phosphatidylserine/phosphatidylglycerophosphate/cardiolipin synthase-like enzyme